VSKLLVRGIARTPASATACLLFLAITLASFARPAVAVTTVNSGMTLTGDTTTITDPSIIDMGTVDFNQSFDGTYAGAISSAGAIPGMGNVVKDGIGNVTFSGSDTYTGTTTINAGTLSLTGSYNLSGGATLAAGTMLTFAGTGGTLMGNITDDGTLTANSSGTVTLGGNVIGAGGVTRSQFRHYGARSTVRRNLSKLAFAGFRRGSTRPHHCAASSAPNDGGYSVPVRWRWRARDRTGSFHVASWPRQLGNARRRRQCRDAQPSDRRRDGRR
jgi:autotransporter-associated beta strand protein